jgi:RNA polymerase sigma-70 factor (ECF subfamily)
MIDDEAIHTWFCREVLPLERALTAFIRNNWRVPEDVVELRQDIYEQALVGARRGLPDHTRQYMYALVRNRLINHARRARIVSFEMIADLDDVAREFEAFDADRHLNARDELRHAGEGLDKLPPRCREVIRLRKIYGYSTQEAAEALGVTGETIRQQLKMGMKALADHMLGGSGKIVRPKFKRREQEVTRPDRRHRDDGRNDG